jgi:hypothetical protein
MRKLLKLQPNKAATASQTEPTFVSKSIIEYLVQNRHASTWVHRASGS